MSVGNVRQRPSDLILGLEGETDSKKPKTISSNLVDRVNLFCEEEEVDRVSRTQAIVRSLLNNAQLNLSYDTNSSMRDLKEAIECHAQLQSSAYPAHIYRTLGRLYDSLHTQTTKANLRGIFRDIFSVLFDLKTKFGQKSEAEPVTLNWMDKGDLVEHEMIYITHKDNNNSKYESIYKFLLRMQVISSPEFIQLAKVVKSHLGEGALATRTLTFKASGLISNDPLVIERAPQKLLSAFRLAKEKNELTRFFSLKLGTCSDLDEIVRRLEKFEQEIRNNQAKIDRLLSMR